MKDWEKKEKNDSKTFNGKRTPASGNRWYSPGDVKSDTYLIDSKFTEKASYSLSKKTLDKLYEEALFSYKIPLLSVQLQDMEIIVMFKADFKKLTKKED